MATELCQRCRRAHPGRVCDYDDQGECAETMDAEDSAKTRESESGNEPGENNKG